MINPIVIYAILALLCLIALAVATSYGKLKEILEVLNVINDKMEAKRTNQTEVNNKEKEADDGKYYPTV